MFVYKGHIFEEYNSREEAANDLMDYMCSSGRECMVGNRYYGLTTPEALEGIAWILGYEESRENIDHDKYKKMSKDPACNKWFDYFDYVELFSRY